MQQFDHIAGERDIAELPHIRRQLGGQADFFIVDIHAPIFEVRYKGVTEAIRRTGSRQVLELASGLTLRGLAFTQDPRYTYIESDLTGISAEKNAIIASLRQKYGLADHANLIFQR